MEKCKLSAKQAQGIARTTGKEWLKNQLFKNIRQAAERGETHFVWDFRDCGEFYSDVTDELEELGYSISFVGEELGTIIDIDWAQDGEVCLGGCKTNPQKEFKEKLSLRLREEAKTNGLSYLTRTGFELIEQAAKEGKNRAALDVSNVPKDLVELMGKAFEENGLAVSYDESDNLIEISF